MLQRESWRREHFHQLIAHFRRGAAELGLQLLDSVSPIQPIILGEEARALAFSEQLAARGFLVIAIRPPTVPAGSSRLRVTLSAEHSQAQVDALLDALDAVNQQVPA